MAAEDEAVLEAQEQVFPDRLDTEQLPSVEPLRHPGYPRARMRRLDLEPFADQNLESAGRAMKSVPFGHGSSVCIHAGELQERVRRPRSSGARWNPSIGGSSATTTRTSPSSARRSPAAPAGDCSGSRCTR